MAGWGTEAWGGDPWGTGEAATPGSVAAGTGLVIDTHTVRVAFAGEVLAQSVAGVGDVLNPATWILTRLDTGERYVVLAVRVIAVDTVVEVRTLQPFTDGTLRAATPTLLDAAGFLIVSPTFVDFHGTRPASGATDRGTARRQLRDLQNNQAGPGRLGRLVVAAGGDYASSSGAELYRKLVERAVTTGTGAFAHLPSYGAGATPKIPVRDSDVARIKAAVERELAGQADVVRATARVTLQRAQGILTITAVARLASGVDVAVPAVTLRTGA